jgi:glutaredoxin-like protein NrdH
VNYTAVTGTNHDHDIIIYALSTCPHCSNAKKYFHARNYAFRYINVDEATRDEKREITLFLKEHNLPIAFPVIRIDESVILGFDEKEIESSLKAQT